MAERRHNEEQGRKREKKSVPRGTAYIQSTFNNTMITLTDPNGNVLSLGAAPASPASRARARARRTPRRSRPSSAARRAMEHGLRQVEVFVKGPGSGREAAIRALQASGLIVLSIRRRHADPAQRLPAAEAAPRLERREETTRWLDIQDRSAASAAATARS